MMINPEALKLIKDAVAYQVARRYKDAADTFGQLEGLLEERPEDRQLALEHAARMSIKAQDYEGAMRYADKGLSLGLDNDHVSVLISHRNIARLRSKPMDFDAKKAYAHELVAILKRRK
ncbi:hypothetical protein COV93_06640 [Candidatus Woesearchaeota archaeon CG11_big_fil_rev_8_21_14_0_20_43_8]|nr:MAG: hypothetical protein COV93_06640 [Candidatus Woesearchaeota archaeon CG11_big_fil_rev_8_21_14_0_20_43_8]